MWARYLIVLFIRTTSYFNNACSSMQEGGFTAVLLWKTEIVLWPQTPTDQHSKISDLRSSSIANLTAIASLQNFHFVCIALHDHRKVWQRCFLSTGVRNCDGMGSGCQHIIACILCGFGKFRGRNHPIPCVNLPTKRIRNT